MSQTRLANRTPTAELADPRRAEQALRKTEARHQALLNALPDLMLQVSRDGTLLDCRAGDLAPYWPPERLLGKKVHEVMPAEVAQQTMRYVEQAWQTGQTQIYEHQLPTLGGPRDYEARMVVCGESEVLIIVRDITERKRAEKEIIRSERLSGLGLLAAALAHEINNPLQILENHLDLMLDFPLEPGEREKYFRIMRYQIDRLNAITRRVLNFAHPRPVPRQPVSVIRIVRQILGFAGKQLQQRGIRVTLNFEPAPSVPAVPDQLEQILLNLVINAMESTPPDGRLHIAIYPDGDHVVITVTNNGPPIPAEVLPHIFEAFYTTKPDGTGLGLWIGSSLVEEHGGSLTAENLPGDQGVRFTVRLPHAPAAE